MQRHTWQICYLTLQIIFFKVKNYSFLWILIIKILLVSTNQYLHSITNLLKPQYRKRSCKPCIPFCGYGLKIISLDFLRNLQVTIFTHKSPTPDAHLRVNIYGVWIVKWIGKALRFSAHTDNKKIQKANRKQQQCVFFLIG